MVGLQMLVGLLTLTLMVWGLRLLNEIESLETIELTAAPTSRSDS
jgi:hypothetical protein